MTTETKQALDAVVALVEKATPGRFTTKYGINLMAGDGYSATGLSSSPNDASERNQANAAALVAATNFLRDHGRELAHIPADWQPTPEAINALPEPLRAYIHRIETSHPSYDNAVRIRQLEEQVEQLQAALGEAGKDSERLDALEAEVASGGSLTLHNGEGANGGRGLGLSNTGRTLRQAIDQCCGLDAMAAGEDAK